MIWLAERKPEIIDGENVFEQFGPSVVADTAGLTCGVKRVGERIGAQVEVVIVRGLVDANAPKNDGWVVPIAADHAADVIDGGLLPWFGAGVLPARNLFKDEKTDLVAAVEEVTRLRIM